MASSVLRVGYRPLRIGFLVRHGEMADIMTAVELNTILWGGLYNPLIPVGSDHDFARQLVKIFRADVLHPVANAADVQTFFKFHTQLSWPEALPRQSGFFREFDNHSWLVPMDIVPWILRR